MTPLQFARHVEVEADALRVRATTAMLRSDGATYTTLSTLERDLAALADAARQHVIDLERTEPPR